MSAPRTGFELRVKLACKEPGMCGQLDDLDQLSIQRPAAHLHTGLFQPRHVVAVHLVPMPVPLRDLLCGVDGLSACASDQLTGLSAQAHGAAEI